MFPQKELTFHLASVSSFSDVCRYNLIHPAIVVRTDERNRHFPGEFVPVSESEKNRLVVAAKEAKEKAYAVYSNFRVGAALLAKDGKVFAGCNVENSSYGLTICAERGAVFSAVAAGKKHFRAIAITSDDPGFITPCGACRQVLAEFAPRLEIILTNGKGKKKVTSLDELFPIPPDLKKLSRRTRKSSKQ